LYDTGLFKYQVGTWRQIVSDHTLSIVIVVCSEREGTATMGIAGTSSTMGFSVSDIKLWQSIDAKHPKKLGGSIQLTPLLQNRTPVTIPAALRST
jgi:hypothetical protein